MVGDRDFDYRVPNVIRYINADLNGCCFSCAANNLTFTCFKANMLPHGLLWSIIRSSHRKWLSSYFNFIFARYY